MHEIDWPMFITFVCVAAAGAAAGYHAGVQAAAKQYDEGYRAGWADSKSTMAGLVDGLKEDLTVAKLAQIRAEVAGSERIGKE